MGVEFVRELVNATPERRRATSSASSSSAIGLIGGGFSFLGLARCDVSFLLFRSVKSYFLFVFLFHL